MRYILNMFTLYPETQEYIMQESPYYTPEQAAVILQKHPDTVRRLCQKGKIEGAR
ncbi:MAG: helix-turn-helix domain-containing protein, partial [Ktedonobacteraceae bacterium]